MLCCWGADPQMLNDHRTYIFQTITGMPHPKYECTAFPIHDGKYISITTVSHPRWPESSALSCSISFSFPNYMASMSQNQALWLLNYHIHFPPSVHLLSSYMCDSNTYTITWCFFWRLCTAVRLLPRSVDEACGSFSDTHWSSSSTSRRNWCNRSASSRLSLLICIGCCREWYLQNRTQCSHD